MALFGSRRQFEIQISKVMQGPDVWLESLPRVIPPISGSVPTGQSPYLLESCYLWP